MKAALLLPRRCVLSIGASLCLVVSGQASGQTVTVSAQCNINASGHAAPTEGCNTGLGAGILPMVLALPSGAQSVEFQDVAGTVSYCPSCGSAGPEGTAGDENAPAFRGISGLVTSRIRFLCGVFLSDAEPIDPAPPSLNLADITFAQLSPAIAQLFFIGDGLTGTGDGDQQQFFVPAGATRLFLGFTDGFDTCIGAFGDNGGSITANVVIAPCATGGCCPADFNHDSFINPDDLSDFITCFFLNVQFPGSCPESDFNTDAFVNPDDLSDFITTFFLAVQFGC